MSALPDSGHSSRSKRTDFNGCFRPEAVIEDGGFCGRFCDSGAIQWSRLALIDSSPRLPCCCNQTTTESAFCNMAEQIVLARKLNLNFAVLQ